MKYGSLVKTNHMCPKDFTTYCIINTILEPAPLFIR